MNCPYQVQRVLLFFHRLGQWLSFSSFGRRTWSKALRGGSSKGCDVCCDVLHQKRHVATTDFSDFFAQTRTFEQWKPFHQKSCVWLRKSILDQRFEMIWISDCQQLQRFFASSNAEFDPKMFVKSARFMVTILWVFVSTESAVSATTCLASCNRHDLNLVEPLNLVEFSWTCCRCQGGWNEPSMSSTNVQCASRIGGGEWPHIPTEGVRENSDIWRIWSTILFDVQELWLNDVEFVRSSRIQHRAMCHGWILVRMAMFGSFCDSKYIVNQPY